MTNEEFSHRADCAGPRIEEMCLGGILGEREALEQHLAACSRRAEWYRDEGVRLSEELAHLKTCSATEFCAENPNIFAYCQQIEQQLAAAQKQMAFVRNRLTQMQLSCPNGHYMYEHIIRLHDEVSNFIKESK